MSDFKNSEFNGKAYDLWSKQYDSSPNPTIAVDDEHFPPFWKHIFGKAVLEIGCGTGRHTQRLAAAGNRVTGIELSSGMLDVAKNKAGANAVQFIQADFLTYEGFGSETFDAAVTSLVLEHIPDIELFFQKVARLLKPGGEFFLSELHPDKLAKGSQAHFTDPNTGKDIRLVSFAHTDSAIKKAASHAGLNLTVDQDVLGSENLARINQDWIKYLAQPMVKIWSFRKESK